MQKRRKAEVEARMAKKRANLNNRAGSTKDSESGNNKNQSTAYENNEQS